MIFIQSLRYGLDLIIVFIIIQEFHTRSCEFSRVVISELDHVAHPECLHSISTPSPSTKFSSSSQESRNHFTEL